MLSQDQLNEQIAHAESQIAGWQTKLDELQTQQKTVAAAEAAAAYQQALDTGRTAELPQLFAALQAAHQAAFGAPAAGTAG